MIGLYFIIVYVIYYYFGLYSVCVVYVFVVICGFRWFGDDCFCWAGLVCAVCLFASRYVGFYCWFGFARCCFLFSSLYFKFITLDLFWVGFLVIFGVVLGRFRCLGFGVLRFRVSFVLDRVDII